MQEKKTRVLITGMCGFIGHHVADVLLNTTDWELVALDRIDATSTNHRLRYIDNWQEHAKRCTFVWHDLRGPINGLVASQIGHVDAILHLAASTHVDRSIAEPMNFVLDNVVATANILDFARDIKPRMFLYFSTDEVFGPATGMWQDGFREDDRFHPSNPYSATKAGGEDLALSYWNTFGLPVAITRCMNVYGERQHPEKFVPLVTRKILNDAKLLVHADATRTRPGSRFYVPAQYVGAVLRELTMLWLRDTPASGFEKYNIRGLEEVDNLDIVKRIANILGRDDYSNYELVDFHGARPGHDLRYSLQSTLLEQRIGAQRLREEYNFADTLKKTVLWYYHHPEWLLDARRL